MNTIKKGLIWLYLITLSSSCASLAKPSIPKLELRTLWIHPSKPGVYYEYCIKKKFLSRKCKEWKSDFYDFNDPMIRSKLKDMGFKLRVINPLK